MVLQQGLSIAKAGKRLNLRPSTAKLIVKKFRDTGAFSMRNLRQPSPSTVSEVEGSEQEIPPQPTYQESPSTKF
jgi:transposase